MLIKKFIVCEGEGFDIALETIDCAVAQSMIERGYTVIAYVSKEKNGYLETFDIRCREIKYSVFISIADIKGDFYIIEGYDDNIREIKYEYFTNVTLNLKLYSIDEAINAVNHGHTVVAVSKYFKTSKIVGFESEKRFITVSDSIYTILN